jgi:hypothetical protein
MLEIRILSLLFCFLCGINENEFLIFRYKQNPFSILIKEKKLHGTF